MTTADEKFLIDIIKEEVKCIDAITKGFKYIKRLKINGKYRYWYEEPKYNIKKNLVGNFGEKHLGYKGKPREAIRKLLQDKNGQIVGVFNVELPVLYRDDKTNKWRVAIKDNGKKAYSKTDVDLVYGDIDVGLRHIIHDHYLMQKDYDSIDQIEDAIISSFESLKNKEIKDDKFTIAYHTKIKKGKKVIDKDRPPKIVIEDKDGNQILIASEVRKDSSGKEMIRSFILTSYDGSRPKSSKTNSAELIDSRKREIDWEDEKPGKKVYRRRKR